MGTGLGARHNDSQYVNPNGTYTHFRQFWRKWPKFLGENTPKMCLLGAHTDTPFWGPKPPTIPQNMPKFHALTIICRKDTACGKNVTEIGSTFFKCMNRRETTDVGREFYSEKKRIWADFKIATALFWSTRKQSNFSPSLICVGNQDKCPSPLSTGNHFTQASFFVCLFLEKKLCLNR